MLHADTGWVRFRTTVNTFRLAVLVTIAFLALLMVIVAVTVAIFDVSDRGMTVIGVVLTALPSLVTGLIVYLKIDNVEAKADDAAIKAAAASKVGESIQHDIRNDVLKNQVRKALAEERHMLQQRETADRMRRQLEDRGIPIPEHQQFDAEGRYG